MQVMLIAKSIRTGFIIMEFYTVNKKNQNYSFRFALGKIITTLSGPITYNAFFSIPVL